MLSTIFKKKKNIYAFYYGNMQIFLSAEITLVKSHGKSKARIFTSSQAA